jgi:hypothetical protein
VLFVPVMIGTFLFRAPVELLVFKYLDAGLSPTVPFFFTLDFAILKVLFAITEIVMNEPGCFFYDCMDQASTRVCW